MADNNLQVGRGWDFGGAYGPAIPAGGLYGPGYSQQQQQYGTPQVNPLTPYANEVARKYGDYLDQQTQVNYTGDLFNMATAGRPDSSTLVFPNGYGGGDFAGLESAADAFAAQAGWRYYPTATQFSQMMSAGITGNSQNPQQVFQWLSNVNGISGKMPWLSSGLTQTQYQDTRTRAQGMMAQYTGNPNMYSELISQAMAHGTAADSWLQTQLTTNEKYTKNAQTPWLQYGLTAQQFKNQTAQNRQEITNKYGANATVGQQADFLGNPPQPRPITSTRYAAGAIGTNSPQQGPLVQTASGQSSVR